MKWKLTHLPSLFLCLFLLSTCPFHKTLPTSSLLLHWISVRIHEMGNTCPWMNAIWNVSLGSGLWACLYTKYDKIITFKIQIKYFPRLRKDGEERKVIQFHYTEWPCHSNPFSNALLEFRRKLSVNPKWFCCCYHVASQITCRVLLLVDLLVKY